MTAKGEPKCHALVYVSFGDINLIHDGVIPIQLTINGQRKISATQSLFSYRNILVNFSPC